jgi:UDP-N-acetylmuramyl pentapeptide synthase
MQKALILDMVHGADILAEELMVKGYIVTGVDVYGIAKEESKAALREKGIEVHTYDVPQGHYDLLLMPVHCPDSYLKGVTWDVRKTFHQAVGELSSGDNRIEVTGVKGKTSCCYLLAHILGMDGRSIFLHTSRGQGPWNGEHIIERKVSIAPTSILRLPKGYDTTIAEVSLGGSGKAEISVITNLAEDYGIAADTRKASDAKASIFSNGVNIVPDAELEFWSKYNENLRPYGNRVEVLEKPKIGVPFKVHVDYRGKHELMLPGNYLALQYVRTIDVVLEICDSMDIPVEQVIVGLESFKGVPGRGEISRSDGKWNVTERNPGISHISIRNTLDVLERMDLLENVFVVMNPANKKICEKMDADKIRGIFNSLDVDYIIDEDPNVSIPENAEVVVRFIKEGYQ